MLGRLRSAALTAAIAARYRLVWGRAGSWSGPRPVEVPAILAEPGSVARDTYMMMQDAVSAANIDVGGHARDGSAFRTLGLVSGRPFKYDESIAPVVAGMSDEHRFLLDLNGYVLIDGALSSAELLAAEAAVAAHSAEGKGELWCFTKDLEALVFHR
eukprot:SAG11_NODE_15211_length_585_cov_1.150206_1_plen_156_part_01